MIPGSERSPGVGNSNPLQYSCLENYMDKGVWWAVVNGVTKNWTRLSNLDIDSTLVHTTPPPHTHMCTHRNLNYSEDLSILSKYNIVQIFNVCFHCFAFFNHAERLVVLFDFQNNNF